MSEKRKVDSDKDVTKSPKVIAEINSLITSENIDKFQKSSIFLQMMSYKKQCAALKKRIYELIDNMQLDEDLDENGDNMIITPESVEMLEPQSLVRKEKREDITFIYDTDIKKLDKDTDSLQETGRDGLMTKTKRCAKTRETIKKYESELILKDQMIAELEKKLSFYKIKVLEKREPVNMPSDRQVIVNEVEKILSENMVSEKLKKENIELRKRLEIAEYEAEQKLSTYAEHNGELEEKNRLLKTRMVALERGNMEHENEMQKDRSRYKMIISEQRNEHLKIEERLVSQLRKYKEESIFFRTECTKLGEDTEFLAQKLSRTLEKYECLRSQMDELLKARKRSEAVTDQSLMEELDNLSSAYDRLTRDYRNALEKCGDLEERLCEAERKRQNILGELRSHASEAEAFGNTNTYKHADRRTFDDMLFSYEKLRDECESKKKELAHQKSVCDDVYSENDALRQKIEHLRGENEESKKMINRLSTKLSEIRLKCDMLEESQCNLMSIIDKITGGRSSEVLEDVDKYKRLLKCTACDRRYKDSVINKCMHVFCQECLDQRIRTRNRMCPSCGEAFSLNDVKRIYL
eukprot:jgi/Antlo1/958/1063